MKFEKKNKYFKAVFNTKILVRTVYFILFCRKIKDFEKKHRNKNVTAVSNRKNYFAT